MAPNVLRHRAMRTMRWLMVLTLCLSSGLAACQGCQQPTPKPQPAQASTVPTVRLFVLSTLAGALEPCGCSKDQLGGLQHLAAFVAAERNKVPHALVLGAGPMLYLDPELKGENVTQDQWKAHTIAEALGSLGLVAWAPGYNDWAQGQATLLDNAKAAKAALLAAGLEGLESTRVVEVNGLKVGLFGISDPKTMLGQPPAGVKLPATPAIQRAAQQVAALKAKGARLVVGLSAMQRGAALRIADSVPGIHVLVVGKARSAGAANTAQPPPELVGSTLVVETANHGQVVSVVDVFVAPADGELVLADAGGVAKAAQINDIALRIRDLESRINGWEKAGNVSAADLSARQADLAKLKKQYTQLQDEQPAPQGSFFRYRVQEVRARLGEDSKVVDKMRAFYQRVNEHNKTALANLLPPKPAAGQPHYVGVEACTDCHSEAREVWDKTAHAHAYQTLVKDFKEYNLECVGCHVTGYGKPGGSTVTHNQLLRNVQCEDCHGPGSLHLKNPDDKTLITLKPKPDSCVARCHHPPHVSGFDAEAMMKLVLGPGHGQ